MRSSNRLSLATLLFAVFALSTAPAFAGGPLIIFDPATQTPWAYGPAVPVVTDLGPLGAVTNAQADVLVGNAISEWSGVATSSFSGSITGDFSTRGLPDITAANATTVIGVDNTGDGLFAIYDTDGTITQNVLGAPPGVLGIATPEFGSGGTLTESWIVLNGATIDPGDLPSATSWGGVVTHEMGHSINMAHTQANGAILFFGDNRGPGTCPTPYSTTGLTLADLETMYPFIDPSPGSTGVSQATVEHPDDTATLSDIYPAAGYPTNFGTIEGRIFDTDGVSQLTGVNVIARNVNDPFSDSQSALSGDFTQGDLGPDGRYRLTGLTPGETYVVYVDQIVNGGYSTAPLQPLPGVEEFFNAGESNLTATDPPCDNTPITVANNQPVTANILFNGTGGPPAISVTPTSIGFSLAPNDVGIEPLVIENVAVALSQDLEWTIVDVDPPGPAPDGGDLASAINVEFGQKSELDALDPAAARQCRDCGEEHVRRTALELDSLQKAGTILDGSFEAGPFGGVWTEFSSNFGTPICDTGTCGTGGGTGPRTGSFWTWFGGLSAGVETGRVSQSVVIPAGSNCLLEFYVELPVCDTATDFLRVTVDGVEEFYIDGASGLCGTVGYSLQQVDLSAYADGASHIIEFASTTSSAGGGVTNFFLDDVSLVELLPDCAWLSASPLAGTTAPGTSSVVTVTADATGLAPGIYTCAIRIASNDPANPQVEVPVRLEVVDQTEINVIVDSQFIDPISIYSRPDGLGAPLTQAQLWNGVVGDPTVVVDGTIFVRLVDGSNNPIVGFPANQIGLLASAGGWKECPSLAITADAPTDAAGLTTISGRLAAGGFSAPGELMQVVVNDPAVNTISYPGGLPGLRYLVNSPDINQDLKADLSDVGDFGILFGGYGYAADYVWDGVLNLADVGELGLGLGAICPDVVPKQPELATADAHLRVVFDLTEARASRAAEAGETVDAWLVLDGAAAREGIRGWEARLRTTKNLELLSSQPVSGSFNVLAGPDFAVATRGKTLKSEQGSVVLARLQLRTLDDHAAYVYMEASSKPSQGAAGPVVLTDDGLRALPSTDGPVAAVNDEIDATPDAARVKEYSLGNAPNPFNPRTEIQFALPQSGRVEIRVYDVAGRLVRDFDLGSTEAGRHSITWDGTDQSGRGVVSGVYFSRLFVDGAPRGGASKMSLLK